MLSLQKDIFLYAILFLLSLPVAGQDLYFSTEENTIYHLEPNYALSYVTTAIYPKPLTDIAFSSEGKLYGIASEDIVEINITTGETTLLKRLPAYDYSYTLGCSNEDKLYLRGHWSRVLYAYDIHNQSIQLVNYLESDQTNDLTFYKGNILYQSLYRYSIFAYDILDQSINKLACQPTGVFGQGLTSVMDSCGSEHVYLIDQLARLYEVNFEERMLDQLHNFPTSEFTFSGMASPTEHIGSTCYSQLQSVVCNNVVGFEEVNASSTFKVYPNPAVDFVNLEWEKEIEAVKIYDIAGNLVKSIPNPGNNIDIRDLDPGIYIMDIYSGQVYGCQKIVRL